MLKQLDNNTWGYIQDEQILVQAKYWHYTKLPVDHDLYNVGVIGEFKCLEETSLEASHALFQKLFSELKSLGVSKVIGPMDGNTWQQYRLTTDYGQRNPQFLLEPYTPEYFISHWENAGFLPELLYSSYIGSIQDFKDNRLEKLQDKFQHLTISKLGEEHLEDIYDLTVGSFTRNPYYIEIDKHTYLTKYKQALKLLNPNISFVAYDNGVLVGYVFGTLDMNQPGKIDQSILKTLAIKESRQYSGLGIYLVNLFLKESEYVGLKNVIYALIYDGNASMNIIKPYSKLFRKYTLYSLTI